MTTEGSSSSPTHMESFETYKAFIRISSNIKETQNYLEKVAYIEAYGRQIKEDDVHDILVYKSNAMGT